MSIQAPRFCGNPHSFFGVSIQHTDDFTTSGETIVLAGGKRPHVRTSDRLSDSRRPISSLSSLSHHLGKARIAMTSPGHFRECNYGDCILSLSGVYLLAKTDSAAKSADNLEYLKPSSVFFGTNPTSSTDSTPGHTDGRLSWPESSSGEGREWPEEG